MAVAALAVAAGAGVGIALSGGAPRPLALHSYRVVYRVVDDTTSPPVVTTQVLDVVRPQRAVQITRAGAPPGRAVLQTSVSEDGFYQVTRSPGGPKAIHLEPDVGLPAGFDLRLAAALPVAARLGTVVRKGRERILGHECTDYLSHDPLDDGNWRPPAGAASTVVSCVDDDGILLHDRWTLAGRVARDRLAVQYQRGSRPLPDPLRGLPVTDLGVQSGLVAVRLRRAPAGSWAAAAVRPPPGMRAVDSVLVQGAQSAGGPTAVWRQLYSDGSDVVVLSDEQVGAGSAELGPHQQVKLGALGVGQLSAGPSGVTVVIRRSAGERLVVTGSLDQSRLLSYLRSLALRHR